MVDFVDPGQYEFDERPSLEDMGQQVARPARVATIRTSDRILFKRCRRRWGWNSHLKMNLGPRQNASPLWYGSGFHFALEDFHGARRYGSAVQAFLAYVVATKRKKFKSFPGDWQELVDLGKGMLSYYEDSWLPNRDPLDTYIFRGVPQVEVNFRVDIPVARHILDRADIDGVVYSGTFDRVVIDEFGQLWIVEYKTAKYVQTMHLAGDPQVTAYCWAGSFIYGQPIAGVIYQQHRKDLPEVPRILSSGRISTNKQMLTTHSQYRSTLINLYGSVQRAPTPAVDHLNWLAGQETFEGDKFIRRDKAERNEHQIQAEGEKILLELEDMLNPDLPLYPNGTRDCYYLCPFYGPCVSLDDGSDFDEELDALMEPREPTYDSWRNYLPEPQELLSHG